MFSQLVTIIKSINKQIVFKIDLRCLYGQEIENITLKMSMRCMTQKNAAKIYDVSREAEPEKGPQSNPQ